MLTPALDSSFMPFCFYSRNVMIQYIIELARRHHANYCLTFTCLSNKPQCLDTVPEVHHNCIHTLWPLHGGYWKSTLIRWRKLLARPFSRLEQAFKKMIVLCWLTVLMGGMGEGVHHIRSPQYLCWTGGVAFAVGWCDIYVLCDTMVENLKCCFCGIIENPLLPKSVIQKLSIMFSDLWPFWPMQPCIEQHACNLCKNMVIDADYSGLGHLLPIYNGRFKG